MAEKFKDGEWVVNAATGNMGYVLETLSYGDVKVQYIWHREKVPMVRSFQAFTEPEKLSLMPPEPRIYHQDEMDVALSTKDMEWCRELQKLKGEKIDG